MRFAALVMLLSLSMQACASGNTTSPNIEATAAQTSEALIVPTDTSQPTSTPAPGRAVLVAAAESNPGQADAVAAEMEELSKQSGMEFQRVSGVSEINFNDSVEIVTVLAPDPGISELAAAHPQTQFLGIGIPGLTSAQNLSSIGADGERPDRQGFLAGYLAAVITDDWRIGVISPSDTPAGQASRLGFLNGGIFYCGLCRPVYPPFVQYPQYAEIPAGSGSPERQAAADSLIANGVKTVYVDPGAGDEGLLSYLAQNGIDIIGGTAPSEGLSEHWVATIQTDLATALREIWPGLVSGEGGKSMPIPIIISQQNEQLFSLGRQALVEKLLVDLEANYVDTGVDPLTGTLK